MATVEKSMYSPAAKFGEYRSGMKGLNYNTRIEAGRDNRTKQNAKWAANRKARASADATPVKKK